MVWNGWEIGGGSIRISDPELQERVLGLLGIDAERGRGPLRLPARGAALRRPAARRHRLRRRPDRGARRRRRLDPRRDRLPEDRLRRRPADRRAGAGRRAPAARARGRLDRRSRRRSRTRRRSRSRGRPRRAAASPAAARVRERRRSGRTRRSGRGTERLRRRMSTGPAPEEIVRLAARGDQRPRPRAAAAAARPGRPDPHRPRRPRGHRARARLGAQGLRPSRPPLTCSRRWSRVGATGVSVLRAGSSTSGARGRGRRRDARSFFAVELDGRRLAPARGP